MVDKSGGVRAPKVGMYNKQLSCNPSFSAYFLRDLLDKSKIEPKLIEQILRDNGITGEQTAAVMRALNDKSGESIAPMDEALLDMIAIALVCHN